MTGIIRNKIDKLNTDYRYVEAGITQSDEAFDMLVRDCADILNSLTREQSMAYNRFSVMEKVYRAGKEMSDIDFSKSGSATIITLDRTLPKRKEGKSYADEFRLSYYDAFKSYFANNPTHYDQKVTITITSIYQNERSMLDYDNMSVKHIIDLIALHMLSDDNPLRYDLVMSAEIGKEPKTIIKIEENHVERNNGNQ